MGKLSEQSGQNIDSELEMIESETVGVTQPETEHPQIVQYRFDLANHSSPVIQNGVHLYHGVSSKDELYRQFGAENFSELLHYLTISGLPLVACIFDAQCPLDTIYEIVEKHLLDDVCKLHPSVVEYIEQVTYSLNGTERYHELFL